MRIVLLSAVVLTVACSEATTPVDAGSSCPVATGAGKSHDGTTVSADTIWKATDNPHFVTAGIIVDKGATLTLEPCTEVRFKGAFGITVRGKLVAEAAATTPILFTAAVAATPWTYVQLSGGSARLSYVTLENGGSTQDPNGFAVLEARGAVSDPRQEVLKVDHVTIKGSQQFGASLRDGATFTADSSSLTIRGSALGAIRTQPRLTGSIPAGSYTGNTVDEIVVMAENDLTEDTTFHARGLPYRIGAASGSFDMRVGSGLVNATRATLTIEPGVTIRMSPKGRIIMTKNTGVLIAVGSAAKPIVFTSAAATPLAGDWVGVWFDKPDAASRLDFVEVKYAGGPSQASSFHCESTGGFSTSEDAAILVFGKPASAFITHATITASAGDGIGRAWSDDPLDLSATNTFSQIARCNQGYPRDLTGACPASVPCVK